MFNLEGTSVELQAQIIKVFTIDCARKVETILANRSHDISSIVFKFDTTPFSGILLHEEVELANFPIMHSEDGVSQFWKELVRLVPDIKNCTVLSVADARYNQIISQLFNTNGSSDGVCLVHQIGGQRFISTSNLSSDSESSMVKIHNINAFEPLTQAEYEELPDFI